MCFEVYLNLYQAINPSVSFLFTVASYWMSVHGASDSRFHRNLIRAGAGIDWGSTATDEEH